jgi:hypothetical protein
MQHPGILAIWNDCQAGREAEFEQWFQGEHLLERLSVPGFLFGRRHQALSGSSEYFNFYLTQSPDVLTSKPYLERVDNPTPMTRKIMSGIFLNMSRTVCHRTVRRGDFRGAYAVTVRFEDAPNAVALTTALETAVQQEAVASGEIWSVAESANATISTEEKLRGGDRKIRACLMIDTLRQADAEKIGLEMSQRYPTAEVGVFRVLCQLGRGDL